MAFYLGERCVTWYRVSRFEGGFGYLVVLMALAGLVGTGLAVGAAAGVIGVIGVLARMGGNTRRRPQYGEIEIDWAAKQDGPWVVPCDVFLHSGRERRLLGMRLGEKTDVELVLPLPSRPAPADEPVGQPPVTGYEYRVRVKRASIAYQERSYQERAYQERTATETAASERRKREFERLNSSSPVKEWLPLAMGDRKDRVSGLAQSHMATRLAESGSLLRDEDPAVVSQTLDLLRQHSEIPAGVHADVIAAGRKILPLIARARLAAEPDDPDLPAEKLTKNLGFAPLEPIKAEILAAGSYARTGEIYELAYLMR